VLPPRLKNQIKGYLLSTKGFFTLARDGRLDWLTNISESRLKYRLSALQAGVTINRSGQADDFNLRRNIHRLEKGLSYRSQKSSFAESYILETVDYFEKARSLSPHDNNLLQWSSAVLAEYFQTIEHTPIIREAYEKYRKLKPVDCNDSWYPYIEATRPDLSVTYEDLLQLSHRRRSVRTYLDKPVTFEVVKKAMAVAALSPSACNRQPFQFLFYNDKEIVEEIAQIPGGASGFLLPSLVVVVGRYRAFFDERDATVPVIDSSLSVMSFLFACETLGLSTVCINWPNLPDRDKQIRNIIAIEEDEFIVLLIGIGYADPEGKIPFSAKHEVDELISLNARLKGANQ